MCYPGFRYIYTNRDLQSDEEEKRDNFVDDTLFQFMDLQAGSAIIDTIQAISLYILLTLDWQAFSDIGIINKKDRDFDSSFRPNYFRDVIVYLSYKYGKKLGDNAGKFI